MQQPDESEFLDKARPDQTLRPQARPERGGEWQQADTLLSVPRRDTERNPIAWLGDATLTAHCSVEEGATPASTGSHLAATVPTPPLRRVALDDDAAEFRVLGRLGAGGMAVVELAEQRSLGREVAIKRPMDLPGAGGSLLGEARITGGLEHPAIVPVHELVLDGEGVPAMVMKRLEGESWRDKLEREHATAGGGALSDDAIARHVEVAIALCNALDYAHSRGVVHLDVKPDNVMVGQFGEVWLLDWGIATRLDAPGRQQDDRLLGTPSYMAPEQLRGRAAVDARTDVFLVGSSLHHALVGKALHGEGSVLQVIQRAQLPQPARYGATIPESLAAILHRACAAEPDARFGDIACLRDALSGYLRHRGAEVLALRARTDLQQLEAAIAALQRGESGSAREVETLASRARFGFEAALHAHPASTSASAGLRRTLLASIAFELGRENATAAAALLDGVSDAPADVVAAVRDAQRRADERGDVFRELEAIKLDARFRSDDWASSVGLLVNGGIWSFIMLALYAVQHSELVAMDARTNALMALALATMMLAVFWALRHLLLANRIRRGFSMAIGAYFSAGLLSRVAGLVSGQSFADGLHTDWMVLFCFLAVSAAVVDSTLWIAAGICAAGTIASAAWPLRTLIFAAIAIFLVNCVVAWTVRPRPGGTDNNASDTTSGDAAT